MKSYTTRPRDAQGHFVLLITEKQIVELTNLAKASFVGTGHRINLRSALKRYVTRTDASVEIRRLHHMRAAARAEACTQLQAT